MCLAANQILPVPCPAGLEYLPYQLEGIEFARGRNAVLFGDEPGLGKTIQAIGWLNCHPRAETLLVVCPASLKINWHRELDKWLISPCVDVTIINYDVLHKLDMTRHWDVCIIDEAHAIKNRKAKRTGLCKQIQADFFVPFPADTALQHVDGDFGCGADHRFF